MFVSAVSRYSDAVRAKLLGQYPNVLLKAADGGIAVQIHDYILDVMEIYAMIHIYILHGACVSLGEDTPLRPKLVTIGIPAYTSQKSRIQCLSVCMLSFSFIHTIFVICKLQLLFTIHSQIYCWQRDNQYDS